VVRGVQPLKHGISYSDYCDCYIFLSRDSGFVNP
jgi:hypothetical protein